MRKTIGILLVTVALLCIVAMLAYEQGQQTGQRAGYVAGREEGKEAGFNAGQKIGEQYCMTSQAGQQEYHFYRGVYIMCMRDYGDPQFCNMVIEAGLKIGLFSIENNNLQQGFQWPRATLGREG